MVECGHLPREEAFVGFRKSMKNKLAEALLGQGDYTSSCAQKECSGERLKTVSRGMKKIDYMIKET